MTRPTALVFVGSQQKGFLLALAEMLEERFRVVLIASAADVAQLIRQRMPNTEVRLGFSAHDSTEVHDENEFCRIETTYGERLGFICAQDRALGHGYLFNVDLYPNTIRTGWTGTRKYSLICAEFRFYEALAAEFSPELTISMGINQIQNLVFRHRGTQTFGLGAVKFGDRLFWFENPHYTSRIQRKAMVTRLNEGQGLFSNPEPRLELELSSFTFNRQLRFSLPWCIAEATKLVLLDARKMLAGTRKRNSYRFAAWVKPTLNKALAYRYMKRVGVRPEDLAGRRLIYMPLHLEPEVALLSVAPEFNNSMEMISWLSRNVAADTLIVVKEHPVGFGVRPRRYYRRLSSLPNVVLAHPMTSSQDWILAARMVATFTGTAGIEAIYLNRPVLSFGVHQAINRLPTVRVAEAFSQVRSHIDELLAIEMSDIRFRVSKWVLHYSMLDISFPSPGFEDTWAGITANDDQVRIALMSLYGQLNSGDLSLNTMIVN